jgi:predicted nucleic-acid-binding Zn-ribbon protein
MGVCTYCLGEGKIIVPSENRITEAEKGNFHEAICPVCKGYTEVYTEDVFEMEDDEEDLDGNKKLYYLEELDLDNIKFDEDYE